MNYQVYVKSHTDMPDFEAEYTEEELAGYCQIPFTEDVDEEGQVTISLCGGKLNKIKDGFRCSNCWQEYLKI